MVNFAQWSIGILKLTTK